MRTRCQTLPINAVGMCILAGMSAVAGCSRDVRLAGKNVRDVTVRTVSYYDVTLDIDASPEQVSYVMFRAIRDDFLAASEEQRREALDKQFDISAANVIAAGNNSSSSRKEHLYHIVYRWTPTVSHYVDDFDMDWETAQSRLIRTNTSSTGGKDNSVERCEVRIAVDDPSEDPDARVVIVVWMAKDSGYWRVIHLGFDRDRRAIRAKTASAAAGS